MDPGRLARWLRRRWLLALVLLIDLGGVIYGFYYYLPQFAATPVWLWPLVPDSPLAVLLLGLALGLVLLERSDPIMNLVGAATMVKVGVWTAVILAWFPDHFGFQFIPSGLDCTGTGLTFRCADLNTWLFYLHLAMAAEAILVADLLPRDIGPYLWVGGAYLVVDVIDYAYPVDHLGRGCEGIFPYTVPCDHLFATFLVTALITVLTVVGLYALSRASSRVDEPAG